MYDAAEYSDRVKQNLLKNWVWNAVKNHPVIEREFLDGCDFNLRIAGDARQGDKGPALMVGSGPTLEEISGVIQHFPGAIFCSPSQVRLLDVTGRLPDFLVVVDTSESQADKMKGPAYRDTILITHPCVDPAVNALWQRRPKKYFVMHEEGEFLDTVVPEMYPWIGSKILNAGNVVNTMIYIASGLGFDPIYLAGVDLCFPLEMERCSTLEYRGERIYIPHKPKKIDTSDPTYYKVKAGDLEYYTTTTNEFYKDAFMTAWKVTEASIYRLSKYGLLQEVPYADPNEVFNGKKYPKLGAKKVHEIVDSFTVPRGYWVSAKKRVFSGTYHVEHLKKQVEGMRQSLEGANDLLSRWSGEPGAWKFDASEERT